MKTLKELFTGEKKKEITGAGGHGKDTTQAGEPKTQFECPMKCEGDKTYNATGNCPVCNMKLVAVDSGKEAHGHSHGCC
ncbi:MAG: hypothetical protein IH597_15470 [Bacteroidales bacterium]|nr:hypothetical protein [Bacteroidales bacterium]